ncbi:MAG: hypothetical protein WCQ96_05320 [Patescibacteria group bacterium]
MGTKKLLLKPIKEKFEELCSKIYGENETCSCPEVPFTEEETLCLIFKREIQGLSERRIENASLIVFASYRLDKEKNIFFSNFLIDPNLQEQGREIASSLLSKLAEREKAKTIFIQSKNRCEQKESSTANITIIEIKLEETEWLN